MVLKLQQASATPEGLVVIDCAGLQPRISDSIGLGQGPGIYISNKFPNETGAAGQGTML